MTRTAEERVGHTLIGQGDEETRNGNSAIGRDYKVVGRWMRGFADERPTKSEFDRVYSHLLDRDTDVSYHLAGAVETAAKRAGREEALEMRETDERLDSTGSHNHAHPRGHHRTGVCDLACRQGRRAHIHEMRSRAHKTGANRRGPYHYDSADYRAAHSR